MKRWWLSVNGDKTVKGQREEGTLSAASVLLFLIQEIIAVFKIKGWYMCFLQVLLQMDEKIRNDLPAAIKSGFSKVNLYLYFNIKTDQLFGNYGILIFSIFPYKVTELCKKWVRSFSTVQSRGGQQSKYRIYIDWLLTEIWSRPATSIQFQLLM